MAELCMIEEIINGSKYQNILEANLLSSVEHLDCEEGFNFFQQENGSKRTVKLTGKWFVQNNVKVFQMLSQFNEWIELKFITKLGSSNSSGETE